MFNLQLGRFKLSLGREKSALSPDIAAWLNADDVVDQQGAKLVTPYAQSAWVYIAVSRLAETLAKIPFRISRVAGGKARKARAFRRSADPAHRRLCRRSLGETILDSGPAVELFEQPHPTMPGALFWEMLMTWLAMRGEAFILPLDAADQPVDLKDRNPKIGRLITLPTELFWHIVTGYNLTAWRYTGSPLLTPLPSEMLLPSQVVQLRNPNPYLYWRGMSPLIVAAVAAGADYAASQYSKGYWLNNADTGVIVTTDQQASPEQQAQILSALRERKRKAGTADRPLFLWGGAKVEKPQLNGMESQFIENRKMLRQEIAAIFKIPEAVMGFSEQRGHALNVSGSSLTAELTNFLENTMLPLCARIESALDPIVASFGDDLVGWFDVDSLPVMQAARRDRLDAAGKAFALGVPLNDLNHAYDLGFRDYAWGKKGFLPFNLQPADAAAAGPELPSETAGNPSDGPAGEPDDSDENDPEANDASADPFHRAQKFLTAIQTPATREIPHSALRTPNLDVLWQSHVAARRKTVKLFESRVKTLLAKYQARTLHKLAEIHLEDFKPETRKLKPETRGLIDLIFDQHDFGNDLLDTLTNPINQTLLLAGNELNQEIGLDDPWTMADKFAKSFLASRTTPIQGVGGTVRDQLNTSLEAGLDAGESHAQLADRVRAVFTNLQQFEARRIAMTEVNTAYNAARHQSMTDAGIQYKAWLSSHGPHVRPAHAGAERDYIDNPIPLDEPFEIGGEQLMYPGDDSLGASPGNIINCQCINLASRPPKGGDE